MGGGGVPRLPQPRDTGRLMKQMDDWSDERTRGWCPHCRCDLRDAKETGDHVPTRGLLRPPLPENLPVVQICGTCNHGFSRDEEYFIALLATMLSGSVDVDGERFPVARGILNRSLGLRKQLSAVRIEQSMLWGGVSIDWKPNQERVNRVVTKNGIGHMLYEQGIASFRPPDHVWARPLSEMSHDEQIVFEMCLDLVEDGGLWAEMGSRAFQRQAESLSRALQIASGADPLDLEATSEMLTALSDGLWVEVQPEVYRYATVPTPDGWHVRIIHYEYFAAELIWVD